MKPLHEWTRAELIEQVAKLTFRLSAMEDIVAAQAREVTDVSIERDEARGIGGCNHPDRTLVLSPRGGVWCTRCGWRNGDRPREGLLAGEVAKVLSALYGEATSAPDVTEGVEVAR